MTSEQNDTANALLDWKNRSVSQLSEEEVLPFFEFSISKVCKRAKVTLSQHFLDAVMDRVFFACHERYQFLNSLEISPNTIEFKVNINQKFNGLNSSKIADSLFAIMQEFFNVIGKLTSNLVTPALLDEILKISPQDMRESVKHSLKGDSK